MQRAARTAIERRPFAWRCFSLKQHRGTNVATQDSAHPWPSRSYPISIGALLSYLPPSPRILIADRDVTVTRRLAAILEAADFAVETASNAWIASQVAKFLPDAVLINPRFGQFDSGLEAVRALRRTRFAGNVLYLLLTDAKDAEFLVGACNADGAISPHSNSATFTRELRAYLARLGKDGLTPAHAMPAARPATAVQLDPGDTARESPRQSPTGTVVRPARSFPRETPSRPYRERESVPPRVRQSRSAA
ncbi:MAG: DNA-binding response regulator [Candidatus Dadabacteria bacterium]|nr:MAG: DNA-binding response regulator [Candidatus Dadabacteria bacterium]